MGNCYMLIAVSVLASVASSHGSQVITTTSGKNATLPCQIANQDSDLQSLYWRKDGTIIYSRTSKRGNGKYSVTATASLVIPDVMGSDAGNYSCIVKIRKSSTTIESDIMQLYAIDVSVSHCKDTGQEMDGCSCSINGSNNTSLQCSASGFPQPPVVTWEEDDRIIYQSSSVDLTRFSENITLTCKARDENLKGVVANKTVCVYFAREVTSTDGSQVETTTASVNGRAHVAVIIVLSIVLILGFLKWLKGYLAAAYKLKKGKPFQFPTSIMCTSTPKRLEEPDEPPLRGKDIDVNDAECGDVLKDNWKNSKESSLGDLSTSQPGITSIEGESGDVDFFPKDCNQNVVDDEQHLPLVGHANMTSPMTSSMMATIDLERNAALSNAMAHIMQSLPMPANITLPMTSSTVAYNSLPFVLRGELQSPETCNNAFSQINQDFLQTGHFGLRGNICLSCGNAMLLSSVSDPVLQTSAEEDEIPDTPSTAKLLEEKCRDSEESNNDHHDSMTT